MAIAIRIIEHTQIPCMRPTLMQSFHFYPGGQLQTHLLLPQGKPQ